MVRRARLFLITLADLTAMSALVAWPWSALWNMGDSDVEWTLSALIGLDIEVACFVMLGLVVGTMAICLADRIDDEIRAWSNQRRFTSTQIKITSRR